MKSIKMLLFPLSILSLVCLFGGCSSALPSGSTQVKKTGGAIRSELDSSSSRAEAAASEARLAVSKSEQLLSEARELVLRAESAEKSCRGMISTIPKKPRIKIVYKEREEPAESGPPKPVATTEYSASDAP